MAVYTVTKEGLAWASSMTGAEHEEGDAIELDIPDERQKSAVIAAGWIVPTTKRGEK